MPAPRQEVASATISSGLYVIGGFDPDRHSSSSVFRYLLHWFDAPSLPRPLDHPAAAELAGKLYVAGGYSNGVARAELYVLDGTSWRPVAPMKRARGALALVAAGMKLYAIGGAAEIDVAMVEQYDPGTDAWTDVSALPDPRNHIAGFAYQGKVCVAGGRSPNTARVDCYDPAAKVWSRLPDLPKPTSGAGAIAFGDEIVVAGGEDAQEGQLVPYLQRFRVGAWSVEPMVVPRHGIQLAPYEGRAWACGGADQPAYHAVSACTAIGA